jgi:hypothetical protein
LSACFAHRACWSWNGITSRSRTSAYFAPSELLAIASIFRDAIGVLDIIGWLPAEDAAPIEVSITPGHIAQLDRLREDLTQCILEQLDSRAELTDPDDIAQADAVIEADRLTTHGLLQLIQAHAPEQ